MIKEEWRDIPNYEGYYQASNLGRVRSLDRVVNDLRGFEKCIKGGLLAADNSGRYRRTQLYTNGISRRFTFSQLVAMTFLGHIPCGNKKVVDHINGDTHDDRVENLRIVTSRENNSICFRSNDDSFSSKHIGVSWNKKRGKWVSQINYKGSVVYLGLFTCELEASDAYQLALSKIEDKSFNKKDYNPKRTSEYKGVSFNTADKKWRADITINGKRQYLGYFPTELQAHQAYKDKYEKIKDASVNI